MIDFILYTNNHLKNKIEERLHKFFHSKKLDFNIINIEIGDKKDLEFYCYINIAIKFYDNINNKKHTKYYLKCLGNLNNVYDSFNIEKILKKKTLPLPYILNNRFLPILNKKQLDYVAKIFLERFYPTALKGEYININKLLHNMNLEIKYKKLSLDKSIFGLICFDNIYVKYYENNIQNKELAKEGTIYIDYDATCDYAGNYTTNFAIVHECVHWYLHRKYFSFINNNKSILKCFNKKAFNKGDINWMEYQANEIASRILLPEILVKKHFFNIINNLKEYNIVGLAAIEDLCITEIAYYSKVSREAVKIRLLKLGLKVNGLSEYVDGKYVNPYLFNSDLKPGESYSISFTDFLKLTLKSEKFRNLLNTNNYIFVDNHLCFMNSKYLYIEDNEFHMTKYALDNINECCILFKYYIEKDYDSISKYNYSLCKTQSNKKKLKINSFETIDMIKVSPEKFGEYYNKVSMICDELPFDFRKKLRFFRECIGMTREQLEESSYISVQTIKEIENNKERGYSLETIIALCIGMKLSPDFSFDLIRMGGFNIENIISEKNCLYCFILRNLYNNEIGSVNEMLEVNNYPPLSNEK